MKKSKWLLLGSIMTSILPLGFAGACGGNGTQVTTTSDTTVVAPTPMRAEEASPDDKVVGDMASVATNANEEVRTIDVAAIQSILDGISSGDALFADLRLMNKWEVSGLLVNIANTKIQDANIKAKAIAALPYLVLDFSNTVHDIKIALSLRHSAVFSTGVKSLEKVYTTTRTLTPTGQHIVKTYPKTVTYTLLAQMGVPGFINSGSTLKPIGAKTDQTSATLIGTVYAYAMRQQEASRLDILDMIQNCDFALELVSNVPGMRIAKVKIIAHEGYVFENDGGTTGELVKQIFFN